MQNIHKKTLALGARRSALGQSMLEAVIATGIIVTAVSSALTLVSSSINAEKESEALLTAGNLAREGIEAVRSVRDSNWLAGRPFDDSMYVAAGFDYTAVPMFSAAANAWTFNFAPNAVTDAGARVYRYTTGSGQAVVGLMVEAAAQPGGTVATPYNRIVIMDALCDNDAGGYTIVTSGTGCGTAKKIGVRVTSKVRWSLANRVKTLDMEERLMDWR